MKKFLPILVLISLALTVGGLTSAQVERQVTSAPEKDPIEIIKRVGDIIFYFLIVIAGVVIIIAGILFVTAAGSAEQVAKARNLILYAIVGIIVAFLAIGLVRLIERYLKAAPSG